MLKNYKKDKYFNKVIKIAIQNIKIGSYSLAFKYINLAISIDENAPESHNLFGIISEIKGDVILAEKHYRASYALNPTYRAASSNLNRVASFNYKFNKDDLDYGEKIKDKKNKYYTINYENYDIGY